MEKESLADQFRRQDTRKRENVVLAGLGVRTSADIFEAAQRQFQEAARTERNSVPPGAVDASGLAGLGIRTSANVLEATQREYEQSREKGSRRRRGRKPRESDSVERQLKSLEGRPGNNEAARPGDNQPARTALFRSVQMDGGSRVSLAPRPASQEEAHNQPNTAMLAGPDFRPSAEMLEAGRRSLVAGLGLRTVADISEELINENFRQRSRTRRVESFVQVAGEAEDAAEAGAPPAGPSRQPGQKRTGPGSTDQPAPKRTRIVVRRARDEEEQAQDLASVLRALDEEFAEKERLSYE